MSSQDPLPGKPTTDPGFSDQANGVTGGQDPAAIGGSQPSGGHHGTPPTASGQAYTIGDSQPATGHHGAPVTTPYTIDESGFTQPGDTSGRPASYDGSHPAGFDISGQPAGHQGTESSAQPGGTTVVPQDTGPPGTHTTTGKGGDQQPLTTDTTQTQDPAQSQGQPGYDVASMTDEQKFVYAPWALTQGQKNQLIENLLAQQNAALPPGVDKYLPELGSDFFSQGTYTVTDPTTKQKRDLNTLSAAATAFAIASEFTVDIQEQETLAGHLEGIAEKIWNAWVEKIMNINVDSVFAGDEDLADFKSEFMSIWDGHRTATRHVIDGMYDEGDALKKTASAYFAAEQTNLGQFNLTAKDPRSADDQKEFVDGVDKYAYYKTKMRNLYDQT